MWHGKRESIDMASWSLPLSACFNALVHENKFTKSRDMKFAWRMHWSLPLNPSHFVCQGNRDEVSNSISSLKFNDSFYSYKNVVCGFVIFCSSSLPRKNQWVITTSNVVWIATAWTFPANLWVGLSPVFRVMCILQTRHFAILVQMMWIHYFLCKMLKIFNDFLPISLFQWTGLLTSDH